jgi:hypothetical protein
VPFYAVGHAAALLGKVRPDALVDAFLGPPARTHLGEQDWHLPGVQVRGVRDDPVLREPPGKRQRRRGAGEPRPMRELRLAAVFGRELGSGHITTMITMPITKSTPSNSPNPELERRDPPP